MLFLAWTSSVVSQMIDCWVELDVLCLNTSLSCPPPPVPLSAPENVQILVLNSTVVEVHWEPVAFTLVRGKLLGYKVCCVSVLGTVRWNIELWYVTSGDLTPLNFEPLRCTTGASTAGTRLRSRASSRSSRWRSQGTAARAACRACSHTASTTSPSGCWTTRARGQPARPWRSRPPREVRARDGRRNAEIVTSWSRMLGWSRLRRWLRQSSLAFSWVPAPSSWLCLFYFLS